MSHILIVDDEQDIAELISDVLKEEGFKTTIKNDGYSAIEAIKNNKYDLILLDIMMPNISGIETCNKIRETVSCPIIFVSAKNQLVDKIVGFEIGADDYITKPFVIEELVARVKAHIRRDNRAISPTNNIIKIGEIEINKESYEVKKNDKQVTLSTKEFELLSYLMSNAGVVLSKEQIYNSVWQTEYGDIGTVAVNIKSLRKKLDPDEKYIITIWGLGYKFIKVVKND
jgi:DNA-binding response OmpR family regulator